MAVLTRFLEFLRARARAQRSGARSRLPFRTPMEFPIPIRFAQRAW
jgi:hypothetical protein